MRPSGGSKETHYPDYSGDHPDPGFANLQQANLLDILNAASLSFLFSHLFFAPFSNLMHFMVEFGFGAFGRPIRSSFE